MSDQAAPAEKPKLTSAQRLDRVEKALTDGLRIDLDQYDEAVINADRAAQAEALGIPEAEAAKAADAANTVAGDAVTAATDPVAAAEAITTTTDLRDEDALAHTNAALGRWPDDADLLAVKADLEAKLGVQS